MPFGRNEVSATNVLPAHQRGLWFDREPGKWPAVGLGFAVVTVARLPRT
jgi:hypothetical protein